jgi:hypothetical protein
MELNTWHMNPRSPSAAGASWSVSYRTGDATPCPPLSPSVLGRPSDPNGQAADCLYRIARAGFQVLATTPSGSEVVDIALTNHQLDIM